ncbi:MAG: hypothetical protein M1831_000952 [Alyxoria varia]|nr:MAG: hypothetical protein M1831_000952 [Alyxoria varia]
MSSAAHTTPATANPPLRDFTVLSQHLSFEVDLGGRSLRGTTEIEVLPHSPAFDQIRLNCQQCTIESATVNDVEASITYRDPYSHLEPNPDYGVHQHNLYRRKIEPQLKKNPDQELVIHRPANVRVQEDANPFSTAAQTASGKSKHARSLSLLPDTPSATSAVEQLAALASLIVKIKFSVEDPRDGFHFVGLAEGDGRYPHAYTRNSPFPGAACCIFPCVDDPQSRHMWTVDITSPRTLRDAVKSKLPADENGAEPQKNEANTQKPLNRPEDECSDGLSDEEAALEMLVVCSGELTDESDHHSDPSLKVSSFSCSAAVSPNQIGFAIGPFERVDLSEYREIDDDEKLGDEAVRVHGFCLPGRSSEVRNSCVPMAKAVDYFTTTFTTYPFSSYKMCFLDDLQRDSLVTAGLSFYSSRLLFPENIIEPIYEVTRKLVHGLAAQYAGISFTAMDPADMWCVTGMAYFMTDHFLKELMGENEYRYRQKLAADRVFELDRDRPSLHTLGTLLHLDPSEAEFLALKSSVVMFIMDRRIMKVNRQTGMTRIIGRTITNAKAGESDLTLLSTSKFLKTCEKVGHVKLDKFFSQWVYGAGCPEFHVTHRFSKKNLWVEVNVVQRQGTEHDHFAKQPKGLNPNYFMRDVNEDLNAVWAEPTRTVFTGPMTIRIHEADGTPYEHIVEIKEANQKFSIPFNNKYKRNRTQKKKQGNKTTKAGLAEDVDEDVVINRLGDVLESERDVKDWRLARWSEKDEKEMSNESYEWVRMDADFEWICKMNVAMPFHMYVSQLQQDRDVVAQLESLQYIGRHPPTELSSTFLTRTVMDSRYFHGIRTTAASILPKMATSEMGGLGFFHLDRIFSTLFCISPNSPITRQNDFSDRISYLLQCAIPRAISTIKNKTGHAPMPVKRFFTDKLKFNDNATNEFSDCYYVSLLLECLAETLVPGQNAQAQFFANEDERWEEETFKRDAIAEIERHRRIDEWIPSFQNVYSLSALGCLVRLAKANVFTPKVSDILQYARPGNAELVRIKAFDALVELGKFRNDAVASFLIHCLSEDPSPFMRDNFHGLFGKGLGKIAVGHDQPNSGVQASDGLVIEDESLINERQADITKRYDVDGAMEALKEDIAGNENLKQSLWEAVTSPALSLSEVSRLLDILSVLYETQNLSKIVTMKYPKFWKARHLGNAKMHFFQTDRFRTEPIRPWQPSPPVVEASSAFNSTAGGNAGSNAAAAAPKKILKLVSGSRNESPTVDPSKSMRTVSDAAFASLIPTSNSLKTKINGPARANVGKKNTAAASPAGGRRGSNTPANKKQPKSAMKAKAADASPEPPKKKQKLVRFKVPSGGQYPGFLLDANGNPPHPSPSPAPSSTVLETADSGASKGTKRKWTPTSDAQFGPIGTGSSSNVNSNSAASATYGPIGQGRSDRNNDTPRQPQPTYGPISPAPPTPAAQAFQSPTQDSSETPMYGPLDTQWTAGSGFSPVARSESSAGDTNEKAVADANVEGSATNANHSHAAGSPSLGSDSPSSKKRKRSAASVDGALRSPSAPSGAAIESSDDGGQNGAATSPGDGDKNGVAGRPSEYEDGANGDERDAKRRRTSSDVSSPPDSVTMARQDSEQMILSAKSGPQVPQRSSEEVQKPKTPPAFVTGKETAGDESAARNGDGDGDGDSEMSDVGGGDDDQRGSADLEDSGGGTGGRIVNNGVGMTGGNEM